MALIGEFDLKYYNNSIYKSVSLNDFPLLIKDLTVKKEQAKEILDNKGLPFESRDHWAEAKAHLNQCCERLSIAKNTYTDQIKQSISDMEKIGSEKPEFKDVLRKAIQDFRKLLAEV